MAARLSSLSVLARWASPVAFLSISLLMLRWSWLTWPDVVIDFGRELYVPWQLTTGKTLYRDLAYFNGPLSPYLNAFWFRLFGVSLQTLVWCNFAILLGLVGFLYRLLTDLSDRLTATVACLVFITIFAFGQYMEISNYNFLCPYSHELTHGLFLSVLAITAFAAYQRRPRQGTLLGIGVLLGCVFLTKAEVFLAAFVALGLGVGLSLPHVPRAQRLPQLASFLGALLAPPLLAGLLLAQAMPLSEAFSGVLGSWRWVFDRSVTSLRFFQYVLGTYPVGFGASVKEMVFWAGVETLFLLPVVCLGLALRRPGGCRLRVEEVVVAVVAFSLMGISVVTPFWWQALRPLPLILVALGAASLVTLFRTRPTGRTRSQVVLRLVMIGFAFVLLLKMVFRVRVSHYGFGLAMPATLITVVALLHWLPAAITARGGYGGVVRGAGLAVMLVAIIVHTHVQAYWFTSKVIPVGPGRDRLFADRRGLIVNAIVEELAKQPPGRTLAVFPEGVMVNYLSRRDNPTPYTNFVLPEFLMFGEERMLDALNAHPPDYVALVHRETAEYGFEFFGQDYGQRLYAWIQDHYRDLKLVGKRPFTTKIFFGILLMERVQEAGPRGGR